MDIGKDFLLTECKFTIELYRWYFKLEKGEKLYDNETRRKEIAKKMVNILRRSEDNPHLEEADLLASIELKNKLITVLEKQFPLKSREDDFLRLMELFRKDVQKSEKRKKKIQNALKHGKKDLVFKLLGDKKSTSIHTLEILSAMSEMESGLQKIDLINEAYWGIRTELRSKNAINRKRDDILFEESQKILARLDEIEKPIERIKLVEKLYIKVQAPKITGQIHQNAEKFVEKAGDLLAVTETPEILDEIGATLTGLDKLTAIKELFGLTRVHSDARAMIEKKWDAAADNEYQQILEEIYRTKEGLEKLEAVRVLWMTTRMGSSAETKIVELWENVISEEVNKILGDICALKTKEERDLVINRLWVAIARFPEKRKAFKEIFDQLFAPSIEGEDFLNLEY